ncbi:MAG TPA: hypothetical protein PL151_15910 [Phycisphaerae bacterium]|nr:hypothetical protein [Phycisphaerae bacterium]HOJ73428.1 hypothetical protein [Phycisphaerae bacterium]HOM51037.1 hypothetical protein [Phycisphaerae bacterium]HON66314.1 hypothetical protein [Phycisphaerae bacterium]HOQ85188.1 hypothetical protein [Phycisphaerae bacterium]
MRRVFLLSPANCSGQRAGYLLRDGASFELARRLRTEGIALGDAFAFMSGLYFRGKLAYAARFAQWRPKARGVLVITPGEGLLPATTPVTRDNLLEMSCVPVDREEPRYTRPLVRDAVMLAGRLRPEDEVVLLGSIASGKYVDVLTEVFGRQLLFPAEFVGRGDMSRGGLLLRCVLEGRELAYVPVAGARRHGQRPPRLPRIRYPRGFLA